MIVVISRQAEADIESIVTYIARDSPTAAERMSDSLFDACADLVPYPERFALDRELGRPGVRRRPLGNYLIYYVIRTEDVFVLRVTHAAQDQASLFSGSPT